MSVKKEIANAEDISLFQPLTYNDEVESLNIKPEVNNKNNLKTKIIDQCKSNVNGISDKSLKKAISDVSPLDMVNTLNELLSEGTIQIMSSENGKSLFYRLKSTCDDCKTDSEKLIYSLIQEGGNKGVWVRDLRSKTQLLMTQLNKVLKTLETKKLIKAVSCVSASKKKLYMLYDLEPDLSITGGIWYSQQDFESEFVNVLSHQSLKFLSDIRNLAKTKNPDLSQIRKQREMSFVSLDQISEHISKLGFSKIALSAGDIKVLMTSLENDGLVKSKYDVSSGYMYMYVAPSSYKFEMGLSQTPCGVCPIFSSCHSSGDISPEKCVYLKDWLTF